MSQDQYTTRSYKREYEAAQAALEEAMEFIDYLFNESEHCDHISYRDAYAEFLWWRRKKDREETEPSEPTNQTP